ncbi:MAG: hypothetical protein GY828_00980 [Candidatus Gracilibacteria bacterium]|nr:hypothetical protein [Candidatus Gracilibacteria bacterium]
MQEKIESSILNFFKKLRIEYSEIHMNFKDNKSISIVIKTTESQLFIGHHGKHLDAIQRILSQIINNKQESKYRIFLTVNDYKYSRDIKLFSFIDEKIEQVKRTGLDYKLPLYSPYERKKIHSYVANLNDKNIGTKSKTENGERVIYICKKGITLTIDIDGNGI